MRSLLLLMLAGPLAAQTGVYRAPPDTVFLLGSNPHRYYWVRGADTIGETTPSLTVSAQQWRATGSGFVVHTHQMSLDDRRTNDDTLHVDSSGRVAIPPGRTIGNAVNITVRFPEGAPRLTVGFQWDDTIQARTAGGAGPTRPRDYRITRRLRVTRSLDTLGARVIEIASDGHVHYADAWWNDSASGSYTWMDVSGPTRETFWFDAAAGRLVAHRWSMTLRGTGGRPTAHGSDTLPAGVIASESERVIPASNARILTRALPGQDTTFTFGLRNDSLTGLLFVHTEHVDGDHLESGFLRPDGMVGTVQATYDHGQPRTYDATWTDSSARPVRHHIAVQGIRMAVAEDRSLDTVLTVPSGTWAIAEYAMDEMLVPIALTLPRDTILRPVMVFRPTPRHWDTVRVRVKALASASRPALALTVFSSGEPNPTVMIIAPDGALLFLEDRRAWGARRVPANGSRRYLELESILQLLTEPLLPHAS